MTHGSQIIILYTLNFYSALWQLYLNKMAGKVKNQGGPTTGISSFNYELTCALSLCSVGIGFYFFIALNDCFFISQTIISTSMLYTDIGKTS